jgi:hypothetical protein
MCGAEKEIPPPCSHSSYIHDLQKANVIIYNLLLYCLFSKPNIFPMIRPVPAAAYATFFQISAQSASVK